MPLGLASLGLEVRLGDPVLLVGLSALNDSGLGSDDRLRRALCAAALFGRSEESVVSGVSTAEEGSADDEPEEEERGVEPRCGWLDDRDGLVHGNNVLELSVAHLGNVNPDGQTELLWPELVVRGVGDSEVGTCEEGEVVLERRAVSYSRPVVVDVVEAGGSRHEGVILGTLVGQADHERIALAIDDDWNISFIRLGTPSGTHGQVGCSPGKRRRPTNRLQRGERICLSLGTVHWLSMTYPLLF